MDARYFRSPRQRSKYCTAISCGDQRVQYLHDDDEQERRQRVALSEDAGMTDATSRASVDMHLSARRSQHG